MMNVLVWTILLIMKDIHHSISLITSNIKLWKLPIRYYIRNQDFDSLQKHNIHQAFKLWEENTCIRFKEVSSSDKRKRIEITGKMEGCFSHIGNIGVKKQILNLEPGRCTFSVGIILHQLGHLLGLFHQHKRQDRDTFIKLHNRNILKENKEAFKVTENVDTYGIPYDFASIMHIPKYKYTKNTEIPSISARNSLYRYTFGQRIELSFMDITHINRMYKCFCRKSKITCKINGYPNPGIQKECNSCFCPSGLKGDCTSVQSGSKGCSPHSGNLKVSDKWQCLQSPNYGKSRYRKEQRCTWLLKANMGETIRLKFDTTDGFGVYFDELSKTCLHWVEIRYNRNVTETGPRFCGSNNHILNQNRKVTSLSNEVLVIFRSDFNITWPSRMKGFKLCYKRVTKSIKIKTTTIKPAQSTDYSSTKMTDSVQKSTMFTKPPQSPGLRCYVCKGESFNDLCLSPKNIKACSDNEVCSSIKTANGFTSKITKKCIPMSQCENPNIFRKYGPTTQYCCLGNLCNMY